MLKMAQIQYDENILELEPYVGLSSLDYLFALTQASRPGYEILAFQIIIEAPYAKGSWILAGCKISS